MPLNNVVGAFGVLSDVLHAPVLSRLLSIYIRGFGAETEAAVLTGMLCRQAIGSTTGPWVRLSRIVRSDLTSHSKTSRPLKIWADLGRVGFTYLSWETFV